MFREEVRLLLLHKTNIDSSLPSILRHKQNLTCKGKKKYVRLIFFQAERKLLGWQLCKIKLHSATFWLQKQISRLSLHGWGNNVVTFFFLPQHIHKLSVAFKLHWIFSTATLAGQIRRVRYLVYTYHRLFLFQNTSINICSKAIKGHQWLHLPHDNKNTTQAKHRLLPRTMQWRVYLLYLDRGEHLFNLLFQHTYI